MLTERFIAKNVAFALASRDQFNTKRRSLCSDGEKIQTLFEKVVKEKKKKKKRSKP